MASIIPGYNYDIFISYRKKDNKERRGERVKRGKGELRIEMYTN